MQQDLDRLLNALLPFAQEQLAKRGEFSPFGAAVQQDGQLSLAAGYNDKEYASSKDIIRLLLDGFQQGAAKGRYKAVGICADVSVSHPESGRVTDAIEVTLEHVEDQTLKLYLPYRHADLDVVEYGDLFAVPCDPQVFVRQGS